MTLRNFRRVTIASVFGGYALALVGVAACTPAAQQTIAAATPAIITLADLAAAQNTSVAKLLANGQLICSRAGGFVAVAAPAAGVALPQYASVIGQTSAAVAQACAAINAVPVALPAGAVASSVPVVQVPAAAPLAAAKT